MFGKIVYNHLKKNLRNLKSLIAYCSDPKHGGKADLRELLGLDSQMVEMYKTARDKIVHGADIGNRDINEDGQVALGGIAADQCA